MNRIMVKKEVFEIEDEVKLKILNNLINQFENKNILSIYDGDDNTWSSNVERNIERIYGKDSRELRQIEDLKFNEVELSDNLFSKRDNYSNQFENTRFERNKIKNEKACELLKQFKSEIEMFSSKRKKPLNNCENEKLKEENKILKEEREKFLLIIKRVKEKEIKNGKFIFLGRNLFLLFLGILFFCIYFEALFFNFWQENFVRKLILHIDGIENGTQKSHMNSFILYSFPFLNSILIIFPLKSLYKYKNKIQTIKDTINRKYNLS